MATARAPMSRRPGRRKRLLDVGFGGAGEDGNAARGLLRHDVDDAAAFGGVKRVNSPVEPLG